MQYNVAYESNFVAMIYITQLRTDINSPLDDTSARLNIQYWNEEKKKKREKIGMRN